MGSQVPECHFLHILLVKTQIQKLEQAPPPDERKAFMFREGWNFGGPSLEVIYH